MYIRRGQTVAHSLCMTHGKKYVSHFLQMDKTYKKNLQLGEHVASPRLLSMIIICSPSVWQVWPPLVDSDSDTTIRHFCTFIITYVYKNKLNTLYRTEWTFML